MNSLQDALYNWLTIKVVADERPADTAAAETKALFDKILLEEHGIVDPPVMSNEDMYEVSIEKDGSVKTYRFPRELIDVMIGQINIEPGKYENYPAD